MKTLANLTPKELEELARSAWGASASEALAKGLAVTGTFMGRRFRHHPNGQIEDLGPVDAEAELVNSGKRSEVA